MRYWRLAVLIGAVTILAPISPALAFDFAKATLDLQPLPASPAGKEPAATPLFHAMVVADLTGDGRKEIILPGSDGRLRVLRIVGPQNRPTLTTWATVDTRVEGDQLAGACYLTAAPLEKGAPASLVLALPRGIFNVRIEGNPPRPQWIPFCDRTFFDTGQPGSPPRRLDFLTDLDGDGTPEICMPQIEGVELWRRKPDGSSWERIETPPMNARARQAVGALPVHSSAVQPPLYSIAFNSTTAYPSFNLMDLNGDGRLEMVVFARDTTTSPPRLRADCHALRDSTHFSTSPMQTRVVQAERGSQAFLDLNGDGFLDLLRADSNLDFVNPRTTVEVFISPPDREYTFDKATMRYTTHDPVGMVLYGDWNRDGAADLAYSQFEYTFGSTDDLVNLILGREVSVTLRFVHGSRTGFAAKADAEIRLQIRNRCFNPQLFPPLSLEGDFNGDGAADLLVRSRPDRYDLYLAREGGRQFSTRAAETFSIAADGQCRLDDLDGDGCTDVLLFDSEKPALSVLLSRP